MEDTYDMVHKMVFEYIYNERHSKHDRDTLYKLLLLKTPKHIKRESSLPSIRTHKPIITNIPNFGNDKPKQIIDFGLVISGKETQIHDHSSPSPKRKISVISPKKLENILPKCFKMPQKNKLDIECLKGQGYHSECKIRNGISVRPRHKRKKPKMLAKIITEEPPKALQIIKPPTELMEIKSKFVYLSQDNKNLDNLRPWTPGSDN